MPKHVRKIVTSFVLRIYVSGPVCMLTHAALQLSSLNVFLQKCTIVLKVLVWWYIICKAQKFKFDSL